MLCLGKLKNRKLQEEKSFYKNLFFNIKIKTPKSWEMCLHTWENAMLHAHAFQCPHNRLYTLWAEARPWDQCSVGAQRKPRSYGSGHRHPQHHFQHGPVSHLLHGRLDHPPHFKIHTGKSFVKHILGYNFIWLTSKILLRHFLIEIPLTALKRIMRENWALWVKLEVRHAYTYNANILILTGVMFIILTSEIGNLGLSTCKLQKSRGITICD